MPAHPPQDNTSRRDLILPLGPDELVIQQRYETASIANDVMIGLWFLVGTVFFFSPSTTRIGTWLFLFGSIEMLVRPTIRLIRHVHLKRLHARGGSSAAPSASHRASPATPDGS